MVALTGDTFDLVQGGVVTSSAQIVDNGATVGDVLTVQADKSIAAAPGGGSSEVLLAQSILTNDNILGLPTSGGFELVAAPGAGKMIWAQNAVLYADTNGAAYSGINPGGSELGVGIQFPGDMLDYLQQVASGAEVSSLLGYGGLALANCGPLSLILHGPDDNDPTVYPFVYGGSDWANLPLKLFSANASTDPPFDPADYTGGDAANFLAVAVTYSIFDVALPA